MNCGQVPSTTCKSTEITALINNNIFIGEYKHVRSSISFNLPANPTVAFNYKLDYTSFEYKYGSLMGWILRENLVPFEYNLPRLIGAPLDTVLCVDVYARLYGGRITDGYCTVWSGGRLTS